MLYYRPDAHDSPDGAVGVICSGQPIVQTVFKVVDDLLLEVVPALQGVNHSNTRWFYENIDMLKSVLKKDL